MMRIVNAGKKYGELEVLHGVSVRIDDGDFIIVRGKSGSGKSTLLKIIGGVLPPDEGKILWNGVDICRYKESEMVKWRRSSLGFVFQSPELIPYLSAKENAALPMIYNGCPRRSALIRAGKLLKMVGLSERMNHYPAELSGGEAQRCAIARSLGNMPSMLLCDEPSGALDPFGAKSVMKLLKMVNQYRKTVIVVTHDPAWEAFGNRVWDLSEGRLTER